jgi:transmembrane sensor
MKNMKPDFVTALGEAARLIDKVGLPAEIDRRLRARLAEASKATRSAPRQWTIALTLACAGAAGILWVVRPLPTPLAPVADSPTSPRLASGEIGGLAIEDASTDFKPAIIDGAVEIESGSGTLVDRSTHSAFVTTGNVRLRKENRGVRLLRGKIVVAVHKRAPADAPARVLVSHGAIEVMGTRFSVEQDANGGRVILHEGAIRFVASDGKVTKLAPGDSAVWPTPAPASVTVSTPGPSVSVSVSEPTAAKPRTEPPAPRPAEVKEPLEQLLERLATLRSRNRFDEAASEIRRVLDRGEYQHSAQERLSYELGSLLSRQPSSVTQACAHWNAHVQKFGRGRYDWEVQQAKRTLGCQGR